MSTSLPILILAVSLLGGLALLLSRLGISVQVEDQEQPAWKSRYPFDAKRHFLSEAERAFLGVLEQAVGRQYRVFAKPGLADLLEVRATAGSSEWRRQRNRIEAKHVDFVLCDPRDLSLVAAVELDDQTHQRPERRARDLLVDSAFAAAGIPLYRITSKAAYSVHEVRDTLAPILGAEPTAAYAEGRTAKKPSITQPETEQVCPRCGGPVQGRARAAARPPSNSSAG